MNKKIIGIPKAFLYYRYHVLWKTYLNNLGYKIITSQNTTTETIELGKIYSIDESCLSSKIYMGHVASLKDKCDYILIPRIDNYGTGEKVCVKFNATYDLVKNLFEEYQILDYNIDNTKHNYETINLIKLGLKLNKNPFKVLKSLIIAKQKDKKYRKLEEQKQESILQNDNPKILIVAHPYNIYDKFIGAPIIKKIKSQGIDIIYADKLNKKTAKLYYTNLSKTLYWTYSKELIGAIDYYRYSIDGILFLSSFPCGPDSLVNELMLRKIDNIPMTNILIDEQTSDTGLDTRIESFIDIINERRKTNEQYN